MEEYMEEFMNYLKDEFTSVPWACPWVRELVENVIRYAYERYGHSKNAAKYMLCDIIPEVNFEEMKMLPPFSPVGGDKA